MDRTAPRSRLARALAALAVASVLIVAGCASSSPFTGQTTEGEAIRVHDEVIHYITRFYQPRALDGEPAAWCVAVGRRSFRAVDPNVRQEGEPWDPSPRLMARLSDIDPEVRPVHACEQGRGQEERLRDSGEPAILLLVSHPQYESHERARVEVRMRESPVAQDRAVCRLILGVEGWRIRECV